MIGKKLAVLTFALTTTATVTAATYSGRAATSRYSSSSAHCSFPESVYKASAATLRSCGDVIHPLRKVTALPGGGEAYIYSVDGMEVEKFMPPPGFNPFRASARKLREYGLPPRPANDQQHWIAVMKNFHPSIPPAFLVSVPSLRFTATRTQNSWAGYMAVNKTTYNWISANWYEPHIYSSRCTKHLGVSTWVGLSDNISDAEFPIAQVGTAYGERYAGISAHGSFWEWVPALLGQSLPVAMKVVAHAGDHIHASVQRGVNASGDKGYWFVIQDLSQSGSQSYDSAFLKTTKYSGKAAEVITERPEWINNSTFPPTTGMSNLENFKSYLIFGIKVGDSAGTGYLGNFPHEVINMVSSSDGHELAQPSALSGGTDYRIIQCNCS